MYRRTTQTILIFLLSVFLTACGGRAAAPVMVHQYGDEKKSCEALEKEIAFIEGEIQRLIPKTDKTGANVALGVAGAFLLVPWFFMDFSESEQIEINALRQRYNHLVILAGEKDCGFKNKQIPDFNQQQPVESTKQEDSKL